MVTKRKMRNNKVEVTFNMPALEGVSQLNLVGDFNNWSIVATPLTQTEDGWWTAVLTLDSGKRYEYRYLANGRDWHNDWTADAYVPNQYGTDNSVVDLAGEESAPAKKQRAPRSKASTAQSNGAGAAPKKRAARKKPAPPAGD